MYKFTKHFFVTGELLQGINDTNIVLIPKKKNPIVVGDLRPVALCNVIMKIITKIMANRMKSMLQDVVSVNQSAFIPNRLISDNIMISYEIMHYLKGRKVGKDGYMALKLDMSKAYDRVEWNFLREILLKMGFSQWWVSLVLKCVTTVNYTIIHGEHEMGPICPTRGIRQGDPLSPYLFIICAEGFSALLRKYEERKWIQGVKICRKAAMVTHMLFADDSYLFCKANSTEAQRILEILELYKKASGQQVNRNKSSIFYSSNVLQYNKDSIAQWLQMVEANDHSTYLGLPNIIGRNKSALLGFLKDKVDSRIRSWDGNYILRSGKEILVKHVAQTLPSYAMNIFLLPLDITRNIEKSLTRFWWNSGQNSKSKLNWMSWERMAKHKNAGGMGFRHFRDFNIAMLGKQLWRLASIPNILVSRLYKAKYYHSSNIFHARLGHNPSFIWRSLLEAQQLLKEGAHWRVDDGSTIQILDQPWLLVHENPYITSMLEPLQNNVVASLFRTDKKEWDIEVVKDVLNERDQVCVLAILRINCTGDLKERVTTRLNRRTGSCKLRGVTGTWRRMTKFGKLYGV